MPWKINWSSVKVIHVDLVSPLQEVLPYLDQACRLETLVVVDCTLSPMSAISSDAKIPPPIKLASLKVLYTDTPNSLLLFETPALEELFISRAVSANSEFSCKTIFSRFFSSLRRLRRFGLCANNTEDAQRIFQYMPIVQDISMDGNDVELLRTLSECPNARHLESVTFGIWRLKGPKRNLLRDMILSWRRHASGGIGSFENLTRISLGWYNNPDCQVDGFCYQLEQHLVKQGVKGTIARFQENVKCPPLFDDYNSSLYI
jgi:hypothetical protein